MGFSMMPIRFVIIGEAHSKSNTMQIVKLGNRYSLIKSAAARAFEADSLAQIPVAARQRLVGPVKVTMRMIYASNLHDLDESLLLDVLQDRYGKAPAPGKPRPLLQAGVYRNDRQVEWKDIRRGPNDPSNPRVEVTVESLMPITEQPDLLPPQTMLERVRNSTEALPF